MRTLEISGSPRAMGQAHGEACRDLVHALYNRRIANAVEQARTYGGRTIDEAGLLSLSDRCVPMVQTFHPEGWDELCGIAEGAGLTPAQVWTMNALTDLRDVAAFADISPADGEGCSSFVVQADRTAQGRRFCGQTWDLSTDNMPHVLMVRRTPTDGPETLCLTTTGCLSLVGMNAYGVAVGTTNIRSYDSRLGVCYLDVIHKALTASTTASAQTIISEAPRAGAHYFFVLDASGAAVALECTAAQHEAVPVSYGAYIHCNHFLAPSLLELEVKGTPMASSHHRQARLTALLESASAPITPDDLMAFLSDREGGANAISRHDFAGISSNGAIIIEPTQGQLWAVHGPPDAGQWQRMTVQTGPYAGG